MAKILMCGNDCLAEAAIQAGCRFYAGYPITPQNELVAYMAKRMPEIGGTFIQSESELAAVNMVFGASAAGARAMTSSSSPGVSLKQEGISYIAGCQLPAVIVNMMRGGPGLGNIAPAQADYFQATKSGHGDYHSIVLAPSSVQEIQDLVFLAFDLADKYRNPVVILGDAILGQMMEPVELTTKSDTRNPIPEKKWALTGCKGREPNIIRSLYLGTGNLERHNEMLQEKYAKIETNETRFETFKLEDAELVLVAYGTTSRICRAAVIAAREEGIKAGLIRPITLWPFPKDIISQVAERVRAFLVVEMSAGQMVEDVKLAAAGFPVHLHRRMGGGVPTEEAVVEKIREITGAVKP